jgi:1-acyl-sn-glycerol-3-phosphate acyltransferase
VIVVANHRSFFDFYFISSVITRRTRLMREVTFPVRSPFFYDNPLGLVLNIALSGATMWPPVFRDERRRTLNPTGLQQVSASLSEGVVMGIHPEGTRNKNDDPHSFLPLKPGLGQLIEVLDPGVVLLPCFVAGASSSVVREVGRNFKPVASRGEPIRIRFGAPQTAADLLAQSRDAATLTELAFAPVRTLCEADRLEFGRPQA